MEVKMFEAIGMVAMKKNDEWGLYIYDEQEGKASLIPVDFAQNLKRLEVYEHNNMLVTQNAVYSLGGEKLLEHTGDVKIIKLKLRTLIVASGGMYGLQVLVWDNEKVLIRESCTCFRYSDKYLALCYKNIWSLFKTDGKTIDEGAFQADDVEIHSDLLITKSVGKQDLYSFRKANFIKKDQTKIICSDDCNLALCARIGDDTLNVYSFGHWHQIPNVSEFNLVKGMGHMFYVKRSGKYFLYEDMHRFMQNTYPNGVDFVACENNLLMIVNDGEPCFYSQVC